jgi:hypothetical protein
VPAATRWIAALLMSVQGIHGGIFVVKTFVSPG